MPKLRLVRVVISFMILAGFQRAANCQSDMGAATAIVTPPSQPSLVATSTPTSYKVIYTGRLYGYFRYPEVQTSDKPNRDCPAENPDEKSAREAFEFRKELENINHDNVLVSMGDNFAPFLLSRRVWIPKDWTPPSDSHSGQESREQQNKEARAKQDESFLAPKEDYLRYLQNDNVGCFLRLAHFDAVVPGKHDFYFGPQHLQRLAEYLHKEKVGCSNDGNTPCYRPVRMLAGNLSLKAERTDSEQKDGGGDSSGGPGVKPEVQEKEPKFVLPKVVLPWMSAIRILNVDTEDKDKEDKDRSRFFLCKYPPGKKDDDIKKEGCKDEKRIIELKLKPPVEPSSGDMGLYQDKKDYYWMSWTKPEPESKWDTFLEGNFVYGIFEEKSKKYLKNFKVAKPFFYRSEDRRAWALVRKPGQNVAVFGVVDPDLDQFIGQLNYTWLGVKDNGTVDDSYVTVVNASDPAEALNQILQSCYYHEDCRTARKVLLAQMSQGKLQENVLPLLHLPPGMAPFDIAIAAVDPNSATGNRTTKLEAPDLDEGNPDRDPLQRPTVLVPGSHFDPKNAYKVRVRLQEATITTSVSMRVVRNKVYLDKTVITSSPFNDFTPPLDALKDDTAEADVLIKKIAEEVPFDPGKELQKDEVEEWRDGLERIGLDTMRNACDSDIAMLQHRDVFFDPSVLDAIKKKKFTPAGIKVVIDLILWKGDYIQCVNVTGQTLSSVLQRSSELQHTEDEGQYTELSRGWPLAYTGISPAKPVSATGKPQWLVHGEYLDPKRLYSVALTDYLANGDTGYPDLQNAQPDPQIKLADLRLRLFAEHMADRLLGGHSQIYAMREELPRLNSTKDLSPKPSNVFYDWLKSWFKVEAFDPKLSPEEGFDFAEQQMHTMFLRLYKADFGYSLFQHNVNEAAIGSKFPGVTAVDLSNPDSQSFNADLQLRWQYDWRRWETYTETDANFGRRNQRSKSPPQFAYQPSQTADVWYLETGAAMRLSPPYQNPSGWKLILPTSVKSQIVRPYTQITPLNAKPSSGSANPVSAPRNYYWAFRPGFRFEHNFPRPQNAAQGGGGGSKDSSQSSSQGGGSKGQGKGGGGQGQQGANQGQQGGNQGQNQSSTLNSYFETGFQAGEVFHSPSAFAFSNPVPGTALCPSTELVPVGDLLNCIGILGSNAQLTTVFANRNFYQQGIYLNFRMDAPLPGRSSGEYVIENRGDLFFNRRSDAPVDVRFLNDLKHSLQLPIYGKFTVGPSIELIFFKTKVSGNYYFSYSTSVSLNYSFDWHPGLSWPKVLGFGGSQTAPNPLPVK